MNDSIWATVLGVCNMFNVPPKTALYDISYVNAILYTKASPQPFDEKEDLPVFDESKDACNPEMFKNEKLGRVTIKNLKR